MQFFFIIYLLSTMWEDRSLPEEQLPTISTQNENSMTRPTLRDGEQKHVEQKPKDETFSSSVFCTGETKKNRECRFANLCYNNSNNEYLFIRGTKSRTFGLPVDHHPGLPLLDLSSVDDHSAKYFTF